MNLKDKYLKIKRFFNEYMLIRKLEQFGIRDYTINEDYSIDVDGMVMLNGKNLYEIPFNFRHVRGSFNIEMNRLTSLKGSPEIVEGAFYCAFNYLENLDYGPKIVRNDYLCSSNPLSSLRSPLERLGGKFELQQMDDDKKIKEFKNYYNGSRLKISLEDINKVYAAIDLHKKLDQELPKKENKKKVKL